MEDGIFGDYRILAVDSAPHRDRIDTIAIFGQHVTDVGLDGETIAVDTESFSINPWDSNTELCRNVAPVIGFLPKTIRLRVGSGGRSVGRNIGRIWTR